MAGDWIKMRKSLVTDGRIVRMMSALQADRFRTIGGLLSAWCLLDEQTEDGGLDGYTRDAFDEFVGFPGLASAMISVGWLIETPEGLMAPNFTEHNGATAKRRAQDSVRKMSARQADKCPQSSGRKPEQEKRREEKSNKEIKRGEEFENAFRKWRNHLAQLNKPLTETTEDATRMSLEHMTDEKAVEKIMYSIEGGYARLYEPKPVHETSGGKKNLI
jgi:hypothetical protein